ncbi:hypothetical protein HF086_015833 [Spodoptera exigua]|uniref:Uncharacterized protein n=1 Tax=Spodoptera exigua TaxID=7107 RepID=A0A922M3L4_SPOEX|nr:hypothetical protein HF086_015833 [Spodoptera exigua]
MQKTNAYVHVSLSDCFFAGQVVTGEIVMASESGCPIEHHRIPVDKCDHMYDPECNGAKYMPFLRAAYDRNTGQSPNSPREQINQMTSWIDGSFVYSTSEAWVNAMRSFQVPPSSHACLFTYFPITT